MSKPNLIKRIEKIEAATGDSKLIVGIREPLFYEGVKINGILMSEQEFQRFAASLPETTQLNIVEIVENKKGEEPCPESSTSPE